MTLASIAPALETLRDSSIAIAAVCGALLTIAAATKLPWVSKPIVWMLSTLTRDARNGYWERHRQVAAEAVEPQMLVFAERIGGLTERQLVLIARVDELFGRVGGIETTCTAIRHTEDGIATSTAAIAGSLGAARRRGDPPPPTEEP